MTSARQEAPGAAKQNSSGLLQRIALATATRPQAEVTSIRGVVATARRLSFAKRYRSTGLRPRRPRTTPKKFAVGPVKSISHSQRNGGFGTHFGPSRVHPVGALSAQLMRPRPRPATSAVRRLPAGRDCSRRTPPQGRSRPLAATNPFCPKVLTPENKSEQSPHGQPGLPCHLSPFVIVLIACPVCSRAGAIAPPDWPRNTDPRSRLRDLFLDPLLLIRLLNEPKARSKRGVGACGVHISRTLNSPPDAPPEGGGEAAARQEHVALSNLARVACRDK